MSEADKAMTMRILVSEEEAAAERQSSAGDPELTVPGEEALPTKVIARPTMPTQAEVERHRIDHIPYRSWCPECVEGFGRERPHH